MANDEKTPRAYLYSDTEPSEEQTKRLEAFLERTYRQVIPLRWTQSPGIKDGFRLEVGSDVYDWTLEGRVRQFQERLNRIDNSEQSVIPLIRRVVNEFQPTVEREEKGEAIFVGDEIARVRGLPGVQYGEVVEFANGVHGMVQDLREDSVGCVLFGANGDVAEGSIVKRTGRTAGMPVGIRFLGRVVNALGEPIDGKGAIEHDAYRPIEVAAPGILDRSAVNRPLETGILCIDSMFPIGRGQRELIIGDRQTGKTAIAIDTIINQNRRNVICIYCAIGQKASSVAQIAANLEAHGALQHTIIVSACASDPAAEQYIAPYAATALGEHFMNTGRDVLIVYDDLSKHAIAYRALSLLLERSPGREAYPGDVFYLHSRLLERSAHLSEELGGGSMTALPIIETQAGDVSAYIPTNVISITDGQIYLESNLFFSGQRPAVNVGLSVSRVGGAAQTKAMKQSAGSLRIDLAQFREMEAFTQFSSDLDEVTKRQLVYGQGLMRLLRQDQYKPFSQHRMVILLIAALNHTMENIPIDDLLKYREALLDSLEGKYADICRRLDRNGKLLDRDKDLLLKEAKDFAARWLHDGGAAAEAGEQEENADGER
ncbi:MAG: F0F1 ATP synthase subunit alpha [Ruminococcaceae bacterium]|nr:F0F1 ATP synthase subunit alpha [Oscillospiraceae bacterium]